MKAPLRILQVITSLLTGGAEHIVVELAEQLSLRGMACDIAVFNSVDAPFMAEIEQWNRSHPSLHPVKIYRLGRSVYSPRLIFKLMPLMRRYDIVHAHNSSPQLFVALAKVLSIGGHVALCTTEHTTSNRKRSWKWYAPIESWMYRRYGHIICISKIAEQKLREYMGGQWLNPESAIYGHISTVNNGVDVEAIRHAQPLDESVAQRQGKFVVTMVAGFRDAKDQDTVVRSLQHLPGDVEVWLVGVGEREPVVRQVAEQLGLTTRVRFWGRREDVPRLLRSSDVVVMSSHWEGLSLSNIEGMSADRPFIASDVDGLRQVTEGYGLLFPEGDDEALAHEVQRLHDDEAWRRQVAERCFKRAQQFDLSKMVDGYVAVYERIRSI